MVIKRHALSKQLLQFCDIYLCRFFRGLESRLGKTIYRNLTARSFK